MSEKNRLQEYCQKHKIPMPIYKSWSVGPPHKLDWSASVTITFNSKNVNIDTIVPTNSKVAAEKQAAIMMIDFIKSNKNTDTNKISRLSKLKETTKLSIISTHQTSTKESDLVAKSQVERMERSDSSDSSDTSSTNDNHSTDDEIIEEKLIDDNISDDDIISDDIAKDVHKYAPLITTKKIINSSINNIYLIDLENKPCFNKSKNLIFNDNSLYIGFLNSIHHSVDKYDQWHKCNTDDISLELTQSNNNRMLYFVEGGTADLVDHFMTAFIYPITCFIKKSNTTPTIHIISGDHAGWCTRACLEKILHWNNLHLTIKNTTSINSLSSFR